MSARAIAFFLVPSMMAGMMLSCRLDVPIREMMKARTTIESARQVMAEKYDPEHLDLAVKELYRCHDLLKKKDTAGAKKAALQSAQYAETALATSLPRAVEDTLSNARTTYQEADRLLAEKYAPEPFGRAGSSLEAAEKLNKEQNLWDALTAARSAESAAREAKETSLRQVPQVSGELNALKRKADELEGQKLSDEQKQELAAARESLTKAEQALSQNNLKDAVTQMSQAEAALRKLQAAVAKISLRERIASLREEVERLKRERGSEFAGEDIELVVTALNEAEALLDQDKSEAAAQKVTDAESSLAISKEKTLKGLAADRAAAMERLLEEARRRDTGKRYETEISRASDMIADGNSLLAKGSYRESLDRFNEAETLLNSLSIVREKDGFKDGGTVVDREGKKIYTVILNRAARDCLWRIAHKVYKNARLWPMIYTANKDQIKDPDLIFPGQQFVIPEVSDKKAEKGTVEKETTAGGDDKE